MDLLISASVSYKVKVVEFVWDYTVKPPVVKDVFLGCSIRDNLYFSVVEE